MVVAYFTSVDIASTALVCFLTGLLIGMLSR